MAGHFFFLRIVYIKARMSFHVINPFGATMYLCVCVCIYMLLDCVGCCVSTAHACGKPRVGPAVFVTPVNPTQASKPKQGARDPLMTPNKLGKGSFLHVYGFLCIY